MAEDPKLQAKNIFNYAREVDAGIAFSRWYRRDQTIKPRRKRADYRTESATPQDIDLEPDETSIKVNYLKTLQIATNKPRVPGIFFKEPNIIKELVMEFTADPANCPLM